MSQETRMDSIPSMVKPQSDTVDVATTWDGVASKQRVASRLVSLIAASPDVDVMQFLDGAYGRERFYWSEPAGAGGDELTFAGMGIAAEVIVPPVLDEDFSAAPAGYRFDEVERQARALFGGAIIRATETLGSDGESGLADHPARPRLFGGFAFQDDFIPDNTWSLFSPAQFILPHYQLVRSGNRTYLTINALVAEGEDVGESLEALQEALAAQMAAAPQQRRGEPIGRPTLHYPMSPEAWATIVERATQSIDDGRLEKVVLSRVCEVRSDEPIDGTAALSYLNEHYGDCFRFLFEPWPHHAFFGATPELLVRKNGEQVITMALAGSIARGRDADEDAALAAQLLGSTKNRHEHQLVIQTILESLEGVIDGLSVAGEPIVMPLRNIQHLLTPIGGRAAGEHTSILTLARRLHPTPAMGGVPTGEAMGFLRRNEPVPRGWYAAPIGWVDAGCDGAFAVAIRSAVTQHNRAWLYAGAGIVADSEPAHEWAETALKFRPMLGALGVEEMV